MKRKNLINALVVAGLLIATPLAADAAGLGKLKVISALGQPLRAEIDLISVPKDEVDLITARIASADAYRQAKIDRQEGLTNVRFAVAKRANGEPYLNVTSAQPFNEPFLSLLIQLDWPTGRLVREYTILLDPPGFQETAPVVQAPVAPVAKTEPIKPVPLPAPVLDKPAPVPVEKPAVPPKTEKKPVEKKPVVKEPVMVKAEPAKPVVRQLTPAEQTFPRFDDSGAEVQVPAPKPIVQAPLVTSPIVQEYKTKSGDTLAKVARDMQQEGFSLEQMMVGLYQANPHAFAGENMNRMKSGQILQAPDRAKLENLSKGAAAREIKTHTADWEAYRQKLAGAVAEQQPAEEAPKAEDAGKITAKAADKEAKPQEAPKDVLKLSKGDAGDQGKGIAGKGTGADVKALQDKLNAAQDDAVAKEKALKEAGSRIADLEKNVKEMQTLLEMKNKQLADLEKQAKATAVTPPATAPSPEPAPDAEPPKTEAAAPEAPVEPLVKAVPDEPKPESKKPDVKPAPVPTPEPEMSLMDTIMSNPLYLGGGAAAIVGGLFAGLWALGRRRKKSLESFEDSIMTAGGDLKTNTVFGNTAGGMIDTGDTSFLTDFSQAGMGAIDTNDVDPIAEAEVYMAYGRDAQAEEILKEAMVKDPNRHEIQLKLLEIYAGRKNNTAFETLAAELYAATSGQGPVWEKAAELGRGIDPTNPLYGAPEGKEGTGTAAGLAAGAAAAAGAALSETTTPDLDFNLDLDTQGGLTATQKDETPVEEPSAVTDSDAMLDLDLDTLAQPMPEEASEETSSDMDTLDFNLDIDTVIPGGEEKTAEAESDETLNFELPDLELDTAAAAAEPEAKPAEEDMALDFDFNMESATPDTEAPTVSEAQEESTMMPELDLSGIDLDLDKTSPASPEVPEGGISLDDATTLAGETGDWEEVSTKLDLARAYMEMGDKEGAREILQEVVNEGGPEQQEDAKKLLASLS